MKNFRRNGILLLVLLLSTTMCWGQKSSSKKNPRGFYKMVSIIDKNGQKIESPFDQYKLCTDSISLTIAFRGTAFIIAKEESTLNYTGEKPDKKQPHAIRIYDSNAEHFTLKWWSNFSNHFVFPENDWCTEFYVANSFSEKGKALFDGLTKPAPAADPEHPFYGKWYRITSVADDLDKVKEIWETLCNAEDLDKIWETLYNQKDAGKKHPGFGGIVINETHFIYSGGEILNAKSEGKESLILHGDNPDYAYKLSAIWLPGDYAIVARPYDDKNIYELWKRVGDDVPLINHIVSWLLNQ